VPIGETYRRIIAKLVLHVVKQDVMDATGCLQLCAGQCAGCEAAAHAMRETFEDEGTKGILLVDASNAFQLSESSCRSPEYVPPMSSTGDHSH